MKRFISFSGGVESTTMCILYGKGATAIWCDTGAENDEMYVRIDECEKRLKEIHNGDFELIRIKASVNIYGNSVDNLVDAIRAWKFMPSASRRWCTGHFKIKPIDKFLKSQGDCELMIGLNTDEENREGNYLECKNVNYTYPLQVDGLDRQDCIDILNLHNLNPHFPIYMKRGGCFMCIYKSMNEIKAYYFFDRKTFYRIKDLEEEIQDKRKKFFSILSSKYRMSDIEEICKRESELWGEEEIIKMYKDIEPKICGVFCHR